MTYKEIIEVAKDCMGFCKACPICNGKVCKNSMPGPGAKGIGDVAIRNYDKWREIRLNMDTICSNEDVDTSFADALRAIGKDLLGCPKEAGTAPLAKRADEVHLWCRQQL